MRNFAEITAPFQGGKCFKKKLSRNTKARNGRFCGRAGVSAWKENSFIEAVFYLARNMLLYGYR